MSPCKAFLSSKLFERVQLQRIFSDSKVFADACPRRSYSEALDAYDSNTPSDVDLYHFVNVHFETRQPDKTYADDKRLDINSYIEATWAKLIRPADPLDRESSLLPLPNRYLVPGGRFQEIYYWDTYFTALGLIERKQYRLVNDMLDNFVHLQQTYGLIPNGNRVYYLSRSQPPILALMVGLLRDNDTSFCAQKYFSNLIQEHDFWTSGDNNPRAVKTQNGFVASRYWDVYQAPRPESLFEDIELGRRLSESERGQFYRNLRAACESGWDFSSRWLKEPNDLTSINTTEILPVDLNALLAIAEQTISDIAQAAGQTSLAKRYAELKDARKQFFNAFFWQADHCSFFDLNIDDLSATGVRSLASVVPVFAELATPEQASNIAYDLEKRFLHTGGLSTSLRESSQQWDHPNAWAPLHWFAVQGLKQYGHQDVAVKIAQAWLKNVTNYYNQNGVMMEKYNATDTKSAAKGGEYEVQLGFGWTNGVTLALDTLSTQETK